MELSAYLAILKRRWPIVVLLPLLVGFLAIVQQETRETTYATQARLRVISEQEDGEFTDYPADDNYLASEFAIDDLVEAVRGNVFAEAVAEHVRVAGIDVSGGEVQGAIAAERQHRVLTVNVKTGDARVAQAIAEAAVAELEARAFDYIGVAEADVGAVVRTIQRPGAAGPDTGRTRLLLALELLAAIGAGVLIAFVVDYLDDTLHDADAAAHTTGLPHLATVTTERRA
jgi:capsular polysaccharide biosynthesis protein